LPQRTLLVKKGLTRNSTGYEAIYCIDCHPQIVPQVEISYRTALSIAREQGTRGFELRAAVSLARLLTDKGRREEARDLLTPVYGWFTEGFDAPDLKEAEALLEALDE
jgi:predicted ATPase